MRWNPFSLDRWRRFALVTAVSLAGSVYSPCWALSPVRDLVQENRLDEAVPICRQFEVLSTTDNDSFLACAWVFFRIDQPDSAERMMQRVRNPASLPEYQLLQVYSQMKHKQYDPARRTITTLTEEHRGGPFAKQIQEVSAELYEAVGQLDTAAFIYKQLVSEDPQRVRAHWGLGRYYLARNDLGRAKMHLETTAKLWPKHLGSRYNLGVMNLQAGNLPDAGKWLAEAYRLNRADVGVLEQLGVLFEKKGMLGEAVKYWQRAADVSKDAVLAREKLKQHTVQLVDNLIESKQYDQALAQLDAFVRAGAKNPQFALRRGIILRNLGKFDPAMRELTSYLNTAPRDPLALRELGVCQLNLKQPEAALKYFLRAVDADPQNGMGFAWLAFTLEAKNKLSEARDAWRRAISLLTEPEELEKANRRLAAIEKRIPRRPDSTNPRSSSESRNRLPSPPAGSGIQVPKR